MAKSINSVLPCSTRHILNLISLQSRLKYKYLSMNLSPTLRRSFQCDRELEKHAKHLQLDFKQINKKQKLNVPYLH